MKTCGECTLCCKIVSLPELEKPANVPCHHCVLKKGCAIYDTRPQGCRDYTCLWLISAQQPDAWRPDKTHLYVEKGSEVMTVRVDTDHPSAWQQPPGQEVVEHLLTRGYHVLIAVGRQLTFLASPINPVPRKLLIDWVL